MRIVIPHLSERLTNLFWSLFMTMMDLALVWSAATITKSSNCIPMRHSILSLSEMHDVFSPGGVLDFQAMFHVRLGHSPMCLLCWPL